VEAIIAKAVQAAKDAGAVLPLGHVGTLYMKLYWLFQPNDMPQGPWLLPADHFTGLKHIEPNDFADPASLATVQGTAAEFRGIDGPKDNPTGPGRHRVVWTVASRDDALKAIAQIAAQGEGVATAQNSHFLEFFRLYNDFNGFKDPAGRSPVLKAPTNPVAANFQGPAKLWAQLFNTRYQMLLLELPLALVQPRNTNSGAAGREKLIKRALDTEMKGDFGVRGLGLRLMGLPGAAPPFELPDTSLPQKPDGQKQLLVKLLGQSKDLIGRLFKLQGADALSSDDKDGLQSVLDADQQLLQALSGS
jgi:hypothetical protein